LFNSSYDTAYTFYKMLISYLSIAAILPPLQEEPQGVEFKDFKVVHFTVITSLHITCVSVVPLLVAAATATLSCIILSICANAHAIYMLVN
jgi:hypothetical protein